MDKTISMYFSVLQFFYDYLVLSRNKDTSAERKQLARPACPLRKQSEAPKNTSDKLSFVEVNLIGWSHRGEVSLDFALNT